MIKIIKKLQNEVGNVVQTANFLQQKWNGEETVLLKSSKRNILLVAMHEGNELHMNGRNEPVNLQILEGILRVTDHAGSTFLGKDQCFVLNENIRHGFMAMDDTTFLLSK